VPSRLALITVVRFFFKIWGCYFSLSGVPGGNSFNEALQYGIPQLVCSQWFDTIDYAVAARTSGIGLSSENPGRISGHDVSDKVSRLLTEKSFMDKTRLWSLKSRAAGGSRAAA
jgi:UDP:flavonoid glycosyltransferase YjiC (YdhE family)